MDEIQVRTAPQTGPPAKGHCGTWKVTSNGFVIYSELLWQLFSGVAYWCTVCTCVCLCLGRGIRRKFEDGLLLSPIQTLCTGTDQEQQVKKRNDLLLALIKNTADLSSVTALREHDFHVSSRWRQCHNWQVGANTCSVVFFCLSAPCFFPFLFSHTTTTASSPSCLFFPGPQCCAPGSGPASPQPIRLTRPVMKQTSAADIVLEKPVETGWVTMSFTLFLHSHHFHV